MKIEGYPDKKNLLIGRLTGLIHKIPVYNGAPEFSYDVGPYRVTRDGALTVLEDDADPVVLDTLIQEQLLVDPEMQAAPAEEAGPSGPETVPVSSQAIGMQESVTEPEQNPEPAAQTFSVVKEVRSKSYGEPIVISDRVVTVQTMVNLLNMIHSKGEILNHALLQRRAFWVDERVIADLPYEKPASFQALTRILKTKERAGLARGIEFTPTSVIFTGFPATNDPAVRKTYEQLARAMYSNASAMKWISSKQQSPDNERYYFRNWLNHIGLSGQENATYREILLKNLDGNGTYRTKAQLVAYRSRRKEERAANLRPVTEQTALATAIM